MRKKSRPDPKYRRHKQSGNAIVTLPDGMGGRRDVLLGKYGTKASQKEYERVIADWKARKKTLKPAATCLTINEILLPYVRHVREYYRHADGTPTNEVANIFLALRPVKALFGPKLATEFDSLALEAVRNSMIDAGRHRPSINKDIARIRRAFRWAASRKLIPSSVYHDLATLESLKAGRSAAKEPKKVGPVPLADVDATLPFLTPTLADAVRLHLLTGMRSGELLAMRRCDVETSEPVWTYIPATHKTAHHGHRREIAIGPKAQAILNKYLLRSEPEAFLFRPIDSVAEFRAKQRATRKSKVQPSQMNRRKRKREKAPGDRYTPATYAASIGRAIKRANAEARKADPANPKEIPHWHPHQLRHAAATLARREAGLEASRVLLGHRSVNMTTHYAEADRSAAIAAAAKIG